MGISRPLSISRMETPDLKIETMTKTSLEEQEHLWEHTKRVDPSDQVADAGLCSQSEEEPGISLYSKVHSPPAALGLGGTQQC